MHRVKKFDVAYKVSLILHFPRKKKKKKKKKNQSFKRTLMQKFSLFIQTYKSDVDPNSSC